ncbi:MAG: LysM peptidoglycan-binding domain-containing protein [Kiloniellaceae bacterium]
MNRARIIVGLVVVVGLAVLGYLLLSDKEPPAPVTAEVAPGAAPERPTPQVPAQKAPETPAQAPRSDSRAAPPPRAQAAPAQPTIATAPSTGETATASPAREPPAATTQSEPPTTEAPTARPRREPPEPTIATAPSTGETAAVPPVRETPVRETPAATAQSEPPATETPTSEAPTVRPRLEPREPAIATTPSTGQTAAVPPVRETPAATARSEPPAAEATAVRPRRKPADRPLARPGILPSFDVVRVERSGEAVIAGRAPPGSIVTVLDGGRHLGQVTANVQGQWVLVLDVPLGPGSHELSLEARAASGESLLSENVVVVSVPLPRPQVAAADGVSDQGQEAAPQAPAEPSPSTAAAARESVSPEAAPAVQSARLARLGSAGEAESQIPRPAEPEQPFAVLMPRAGQGPIRILQQPEPLREGLDEGALLLETVDYDARGLAVIGGRAAPGVRLVVYLDGKPIGQTVVGVGGRWQVKLDRPVSPGVHRLRVDQVDESGKVTARVETPFSRAVLVAALPDETAVIVQPGNSLWRIARRVYGKGLRYTVIYEANQGQIRDPDLIYPGQIFVIPPANRAAR